MCRSRCSQKFRKLHRKTPVQSLFLNKVTGACNFVKNETLAQVFSGEFCEIYKNTYSYRTPPVAASGCSKNLEFEKRTDQNFITQNFRHGKQHCISKKKKLLKQCQKEVICEYILAFAGWWSFFGKCQVVVGIFWLVVGGSGWWWIYFGWWWVMVDGGGSWWVVAQFSLTQ